jgi:hypothetical protein
MTAEIIDLIPQQVVWRCKCGCMTWYMHEGGSVECAACHHFSNAENSEWRIKLPDAPHDVRPEEPTDVVVTNIGSPKYALQRVVNAADATTTAAVLVFFNNGGIRVWGSLFDRKEDKAWFMRKCKAALELLSK